MADLKGFTLRLRLIYFCFFAACLGLIASAVRWQVINAEEFKNIAEGRTYTSELQSLRGSIYSSDGTTLAYSVRTFDLAVWMDDLRYFEDPKRGFQTREEFVRKIAQEINTTPEELADIIKKNEEQQIRWFIIARDLTDTQWTNIRNLRTDANPNRLLKGFGWENKSKRVYPEGRLAAHLLGITNIENNQLVGKSGLEGYWNARLNPVKGFVIKENNVFGESVTNSLIPTIEPKGGSSLYTSIDKRLQQVIEEKARQGAEMYQAETVNIIIMDPKTGKIMAFANYPSYDPNERKETGDVYTDKALTAPYEMGSTGKALTLAAAIDQNAITLDTIVLPEGHQGCEQYDIPNPTPKDQFCTWDKKPQPPMTVTECLIRSDNICFAHIARNIDNDTFYEYLDKFGVGRATGIDLFNDDPGFIPPTNKWTVSEEATISYGHGYQLTALQAIDSISTIANKGIRMKPYLVERIVKSDGEEIIQNPTVLEKVVSEEAAQTVANAMHEVYLNDIKDWEPYYQHLKSYPIAAKSGTAIIYDNNVGDYINEINATYVGFDISPERRFVMLIRLEKPKVGDLSFYNVRPLWLDTFNAIKDFIGMKPNP